VTAPSTSPSGGRSDRPGQLRRTGLSSLAEAPSGGPFESATSSST
jgi:hypothetical protein